MKIKPAKDRTAPTNAIGANRWPSNGTLKNILISGTNEIIKAILVAEVVAAAK